MKRRPKKPKVKKEPSPEKKPRISPDTSPYSISAKKPVWRIGMLDFEGKWGWEKIGKLSAFKEIQERLKSFETMTWSEIEKKKNERGGKQNHSIRTISISKEAKTRLRKIELDDIDELYSLRISGKKRIWGIRDNEILKLLWWDPKHTIYPLS